MKKKIFILGVMLTLMVTCLTGCMEESEALKEEDSYTEDSISAAMDAVGLPNITHYFERSQLKEIYELRDDPSLVCFWYTKNEYSGKWVYEGKCIGYGIPYAASLTSPDTLTAKYVGSGTWIDGTKSQAEPSGIYTNGLTTSATWILSMNESGGITPVYIEQEICIRQADNKIDATRCEEWSIPSDY